MGRRNKSCRSKKSRWIGGARLLTENSALVQAMTTHFLFSFLLNDVSVSICPMLGMNTSQLGLLLGNFQAKSLYLKKLCYSPTCTKNALIFLLLRHAPNSKKLQLRWTFQVQQAASWSLDFSVNHVVQNRNLCGSKLKQMSYYMYQDFSPIQNLVCQPYCRSSHSQEMIVNGGSFCVQ